MTKEPVPTFYLSHDGQPRTSSTSGYILRFPLKCVQNSRTSSRQSRHRHSGTTSYLPRLSRPATSQQPKLSRGTPIHPPPAATCSVWRTRSQTATQPAKHGKGSYIQP